MLVRFDPFRELDRRWGMPMNAVRRGDRLVASFDLPGVRPEDIDLTVERNLLTVVAERGAVRHEGEEWLVAERPTGRFRRSLVLGDDLDTDRVEARFEHGVLEVHIPVAEQAKPRKVAIGVSPGAPEAIEAT